MGNLIIRGVEPELFAAAAMVAQRYHSSVLSVGIRNGVVIGSAHGRWYVYKSATSIFIRLLSHTEEAP